MKNDTSIKLHSIGDLPEEVLTHFARSALDQAALMQLQVAYVPPDGDASVKLPVPTARIPYFDLDGEPTGFYRLRTLGDWTPTGETKPRKYMQAVKSGSHLYLPPVMDVTWREISANPATNLIITEGEKKAACACVHGFPTIGLGGVWNWRSAGAPSPELDLFDWQSRSVFLIFDTPDVRLNPKVTAALERLAAELRGRGATVRVAVLPSDGDRKVGLDDFLVASGPSCPEALNKVLESAVEYLDPVSEINETCAVVWLGAKAFVMRETRCADGALDVNFAKPAEVRPGFANRLVTVPGAAGDLRVNQFDHWMKSPRRRWYERVVFEPAGCPDNEYNLWRGFAVQPEAGDCSLYLAHIRENICRNDPAFYEYVIAWMAHMVQRPGELPGTALVLRGRQGTGKGVFAHTFGALLPGHYISFSSSRHLLGNFNAHTKDKLLFFADEAFWAGDKAGEGALKALVTEPTRMLEPKGVNAFIINNYTRLLIASNHDWVVPAGLEERRFVLLDVSDAHMQDTEYFARIKAQMNRQGLAALLDFLQKVDLKSVNLRQIPKTAALLETKLMSLQPVQRFWYECLSAGANGGANGTWKTEVPCATLHRYYFEHAAVSGQARRAAQSELGKALKRLVPGLTDVRRRNSGPSSPQERCWVFPSLADCRAAFCALLGQQVDWGDTKTSLPPKKRARGTVHALGQLGRSAKTPCKY